MRKVAEEWEIWNEKNKAAKSEEEAKKLVLSRFYYYSKKSFFIRKHTIIKFSSTEDLFQGFGEINKTRS